MDAGQTAAEAVPTRGDPTPSRAPWLGGCTVPKPRSVGAKEPRKQRRAGTYGLQRAVLCAPILPLDNGVCADWGQWLPPAWGTRGHGRLGWGPLSGGFFTSIRWGPLHASHASNWHETHGVRGSSPAPRPASERIWAPRLAALKVGCPAPGLELGEGGGPLLLAGGPGGGPAPASSQLGLASPRPSPPQHRAPDLGSRRRDFSFSANGMKQEGWPGAQRDSGDF